MVSLAAITDLAQFRALLEAPALEDLFRRFEPSWVYSDQALAEIAKSFFFIKKDEEVVGLAYLGDLQERHRSAELGVGILPGPYKRGEIAAAAITQIGEFLFNDRGYNRLYCRILKSADHIGKLLSRFGFKKEAEHRQAIFWKNEFHTEVTWALLKQDYLRS